MSFKFMHEYTSTIQVLSNLFMSKCESGHKYKNNVVTLLNISLTHSACKYAQSGLTSIKCKMARL